MPLRRFANPQSVQNIWDAIRHPVHLKRPVDIERLTKYLQKAHTLTLTDAETQIRQVVKDNFIVSLLKTPQNGKNDEETELFKIPDLETNVPIDDGHDWYCIECHMAGDVILCRTCHRVFHEKCTNPDPDNMLHSIRAPDICRICAMFEEEPLNLASCDVLNYLFNFILNRIQIWLPVKITDTIDEREAPWMTEQEIEWRARQLIYQNMDISVIVSKIKEKAYKKVAEFYADVVTIQHNVAIFHGFNSQEWQGSTLMMVDCRHDTVELKQCVDCYRHSNEKRNLNWYCIPCRPPHDIVWAKQSGYPYWPAKVIRRIPEKRQVDVRFFGAKHLRAIVDQNYIKPIDTNIKLLQLKRTKAFEKAYTELGEYKRLLRNPEEVQEMLAVAPKIKFKSPLLRNKTRKRPKPTESTSQEAPVPKKKRGKKPKTVETPATTTNIEATTSKSKGKPKKTASETTSKSFKDESDHVSSSTENVCRPVLIAEHVIDPKPVAPNTTAAELNEDPNTSMYERSISGSDTQSLERAYSEAVETLRRQLEQMDDKEAMIHLVVESMQHELDRLQNLHITNVRSIIEDKKLLIQDIKKKQWCYNCEEEATYHCCWNTAYCSTACQQQHWLSQHKLTCRRKR